MGYKKRSKKGYLFNQKGVLVDSFFLVSKKDNKLGMIVPDNPLVSTIQPLLLVDSIVYSLGFALLEGKDANNKSRFVLCASGNKKKEFFVQYPENYFEKNWGGTYFRMTYSAIVDDSLIVISFPASSDIALFNTKTKNTKYIKCFPNIETIVKPVASMTDLNKKQIDIAKHFFQQYSFQAIFFDKYRNVFYRILNKPIQIKNKSENSIGNLAPQILVYDTSFNYLGFTQLDGNLYSNTTYLIHPKGLLIQKLKNNEDYIYFDLLTIDTTYLRKL